MEQKGTPEREFENFRVVLYATIRYLQYSCCTYCTFAQPDTYRTFSTELERRTRSGTQHGKGENFMCPLCVTIW